MLVLYEQEEIKEKIAKQVPVIARKSTREKPQKRKRTGFLGLFGKKEEAERKKKPNRQLRPQSFVFFQRYMEKQTGISLLVKIESSYLNCRSSAVRPHLGARIDAILSGFSSTHLTSTRLCSFPAYGQSVLHVPFAVQAACHGEPSVVCRPPRQNLCKSHSGLSLSASNKRWLGEKLIEEARKETQSASIPASRFYGVWKDGDFPEVHYWLLVSQAAQLLCSSLRKKSR